MSAHGAPGVYRFPLGDLEILVLGDGWFELPADSFGTNVDAATLALWTSDDPLGLPAPAA